MANILDNFPVIAPLLALAAGALVVLVLDLVLPARRAQPWWYAASIGAIALAGVYTADLWGKFRQAFTGGILADNLSLALTLVILGTALAAVLLSLHRSEEDMSGYLALLLWAAMGMAVLGGAGNLMTVFLGLEILSLALYVMVAFAPGHERAREAALKYFLLGSVAAGFLLFGFALVYGATGTVDLGAIAGWVKANGAGDLDMYFKAGVGLSIVGYAFKLALVPFHSWVPDVYEGAPTPVTAFMSVGTKAAAFVAMARFFIAVVPAGQAAAFLLPLTVLAGLSMLIGALAALKQTNLKRLLGYSGISHAGYLILALPGLANSVGSGMFYLFAYLFMNTGAFALMIWLDQQNEDGTDLHTYTGLFYRRPVLAAAMSVFLFALAGLPPTGGFTGKLYLALAAAEAGAWSLLMLLIISTGISGYVYLRIVGQMISKATVGSRQLGAGIPAAGEVAAARDDGPLALPRGLVAGFAAGVAAVCLAGILWLGMLPGPAVALVQNVLGQ